MRVICTPMFTAVLVTRNLWGQSKCLSVTKWIGKIWHIYLHTYVCVCVCVCVCVYTHTYIHAGKYNSSVKKNRRKSCYLQQYSMAWTQRTLC